MKNARAFTLVELLVVISIIALLMAILVPSLQRARSQAMATVCGVNVKNLSTGWVMYQTDNNNKLVGADAYRQVGWSWIVEPASPYDMQKHIEGIKAGLLFKYLLNYKVYHCPADNRSQNPPGNDVYNLKSKMGGYESYAIPNPMGGIVQQKARTGMEYPAKVYNQVKLPYMKINFLEDSDNRGFNLGSWFMNTPYDGKYTWTAPIATWHHGGTVLGYADGHSEFYKWKDKRTTQFKGIWDTGVSTYQKDNKDWEFMSHRYWTTRND
jgi:prepilin-type N-terminal cleavage/methylation domain-containing protein